MKGSIYPEEKMCSPAHWGIIADFDDAALKQYKIWLTWTPGSDDFTIPHSAASEISSVVQGE